MNNDGIQLKRERCSKGSGESEPSLLACTHYLCMQMKAQTEILTAGMSEWAVLEAHLNFVCLSICKLVLYHPTTLSAKYLVMCKVYTDDGGIK